MAEDGPGVGRDPDDHLGPGIGERHELVSVEAHVIGAEGQITSPDVIVDHVRVDGVACPVGLVTHGAWQQGDGLGSQAAYGVMALGGGALILPVVVLGTGPVVVARQAWRLHTLDDRIGQVTLNGATLESIGLPAQAIGDAGGQGDTLPRGILVVVTAPGQAETAQLADPSGGALTHRVTFEPVEQDRWGTARPKPRYSMGPNQKDVPHYI